MIKLRQLAEVSARLTSNRFDMTLRADETFSEILRRLRYECSLPREVSDIFHGLRVAGNQAAHEVRDSHADALRALKLARQLAAWYFRAFHDAALKLGPFVPPQKPVDATVALQEELDRLRAELMSTLSEAEQTKAANERLAAESQTATARAERERAERETWERLAEEADNDRAALELRLQELTASAAAAKVPKLEAVIARAQRAAEKISLDEADTRALIDQQLRDAGWEADTRSLRFASGARPIKGRNRAISEWPTESGPADYALFCGSTLVATVEAKRKNRNVLDVLRQAERYAAGFKFIGAEQAEGAPWGEFKAPFALSTNGRPYLRQIETLSGIWRRDLRDTNNPAGVLTGWPTPQGLLERLTVDSKAAHRELEVQPFDFGFPLRPYQQRAIQAVEAALRENRRSILVAMATGTGKTKLAIAMIYRLIAAKRFRRVCFIVDRSALGEQTEREFSTTKVVNGKAFADIFGLKGLDNVRPDEDTRIHICTIQGLVRRVLYAESAQDAPPVDQYDLMVVDECHRGYLLDREMSQTEMAFRSQDDYISKYRRVLEHFDAVKIGLTATPALHTTDIFGLPVFTYSYREAVVDDFLVDHEPPIRIGTLLSEQGIHFLREEDVDFVHIASGEVERTKLPDDVDFEVEEFNRSVITVPFNRAIAQELTKYIDPSEPDKTLIFAVSDAHADILVNELRSAFRGAYGPLPDAIIQKITGKVDQVSKLILCYRNDPLPKIAVTVDLLTTGIDVPRITNLVFMRRVNSRILYEQMLGRATRLCPEIGKTAFRVFDAVDLYARLQDLTNMRPVAADPSFTLTKLFEEMVGHADDTHKNRVREQIIVRVRRRMSKLSLEARAQYEKEAGEPPEASLQRFINNESAALAGWLAQRPTLGPILDRSTEENAPRFVPISEHEDRVTKVTRGYGTGTRPEDFLDAFTQFVRTNLNSIAALNIVVQRPQELTREELRQLRLELDAAGFTDVKIKRAWIDAKNEDIAASIIGYIRQAALGDALIPYATRVRRAVDSLLKERQWTEVQRKWIERIGQQIEKQDVIDRSAFEEEPFASQGGWSRIDRVFNGELQQIVREISENIWKDVG